MYGYGMSYSFDFDFFKPSSKSLYREFTENLTDRQDKPFLYDDPDIDATRTYRCRNPDTRNIK